MQRGPVDGEELECRYFSMVEASNNLKIARSQPPSTILQSLTWGFIARVVIANIVGLETCPILLVGWVYGLHSFLYHQLVQWQHP
jgi:hypothetical protein